MWGSKKGSELEILRVLGFRCSFPEYGAWEAGFRISILGAVSVISIVLCCQGKLRHSL